MSVLGPKAAQRGLGVGSALALGALLWLGFPGQPAAQGAPRAESDASGSGAVATESEQATRAAMQTLQAGGSAVDAAISAALVIGVVNPVSSGLGGGGFALVWDNQAKQMVALDFREVAPSKIDPQSLAVRPVPEAQRGALVGVPGELAGLLELHRRWGKRRFAQDCERAIALAEGGFALGPHMRRSLERSQKRLADSPSLRATYLGPAAIVPAVGHLTRNRALGSTLRAVAAQGAKAFYQGPVAREMVQLARRYGGALQEQDLRAYRVEQREPLTLYWAGRQVYTMPPPSAGGLLLLQTLGMHEPSVLRALGTDSSAYTHLLAESFRGSLADRLRLVGDPSQVQVPVRQLLSAEHLAARRGLLRWEQSHVAARFALPESGTSHLVVVDGERNVVSLTTTVNSAFGSRLMTERSGVLLNDELDDFTAPALAKAAGLVDGGPNAPRPGARPVSSMTPVIVLGEGEPELALGGSGGMRIAPNVTQVFLRALVFGQDAQSAVAAKRFSLEWDSSALLLEPGGWSLEQQKALQKRGEMVRELDYPAAVQLVLISPPGQSPGLQAAADGRKVGQALVQQRALGPKR